MQSPPSHQQTASNQSHRAAAFSSSPRTRRMLQFEHHNTTYGCHTGSGSPASGRPQVNTTAPIMARRHRGRLQVGVLWLRPSRPRSSKCSNQQRSLLLAAGWLLAVALVVQCNHMRTERHLKTRSNSVGGDEDEEFTLAHFGSVGDREEPPDVWPTRRLNGNTNNDNAKQQLPAARLTKKRHDEDVFDPFASLFEDYLREASGQSRDSDEPVESAAPDTSQSGNSSFESGDQTRPSNDLVQMIDDDETQQNNAQQRPRLIIEDDDDNNINNDGQSRVAPQQAGNEHSNGHSKEDNQQIPSESNARPWQVIDEDAPPADQDPNASAIRKQDEEIRLQFAWRSLPTNKCSKPCGRGRRILHLSCIDLKYNVRVMDELCASAQLVKPSELSDEICNELDCEPQWVELSSSAEMCQNGLKQCKTGAKLKRLECMVTNRFGETIQVDQLRCSNASLNGGSKTGEPDENESSLIDLNELIDKERNSILSSEAILEDMERTPLSHHKHQQHHSAIKSHLSHVNSQRPNEPFYEPGEWTECSGAPCGQLGRRLRRLSCRLFLTRSSRYVELPLSRCDALNDAADKPDQEEPCYMDCGPGGSSSSSHSHSASSNSHQQTSSSSRDLINIKDSNATRSFADQQLESALEAGVRPADIEDETVYDLGATRHVWRHGAWTKCSSECLGGRSESVIECWDKVAEMPVDTSFCNTPTRPQPLVSACNVIPCQPEWLPSAFSNCSAACGSAGIRVRDVSCVRRVPIASPAAASSSFSWSLNEQLATDTMGKQSERAQFQLMAVPEEQCLEQQQLNAPTGSLIDGIAPSRHAVTKPHLVEPCNRHDCAPQWQVGPWSECSRPPSTNDCDPRNTTQMDSSTKATLPIRNRTVICVQEFASQSGPLDLINRTHIIKDDAMANDSISSDLKEAIKLASSTWVPGKAIQVPPSECFRQYHSVPPLSEHCLEKELEPQSAGSRTQCQKGTTNTMLSNEEKPSVSIDTDQLQDFRMVAPDGSLLTNGDLSQAHNRRHQRIQLRKRTITLKVGGRAEILEGWTVKVRCRVIRHLESRHLQKHQTSSDGDERADSSVSGKSLSQRVEWRKDGVRIFAPNTTVAELQQMADEGTDNTILYGNGGDENSANNHDRYSMMAADEPPEAHHIRGRRQRFDRERRPHHQHLIGRQTNLGRVLKVRSWPQEFDQLGSFQFVHQIGGRFSLVKENTLRIKQLRLDDSGMYSCTTGSLSESIEISVVSKRQIASSA